MSDRRLYDLRAVSVETGLPVWRWYELIETGLVPCRRVGRRIFLTDADVDAALAALAQPARAGAR